jgi:hypothetical protein
MKMTTNLHVFAITILLLLLLVIRGALTHDSSSSSSSSDDRTHGHITECDATIHCSQFAYKVASTPCLELACGQSGSSKQCYRRPVYPWAVCGKDLRCDGKGECLAMNSPDMPPSTNSRPDCPRGLRNYLEFVSTAGLPRPYAVGFKEMMIVDPTRDTRGQSNPTGDLKSARYLPTYIAYPIKQDGSGRPRERLCPFTSLYNGDYSDIIIDAQNASFVFNGVRTIPTGRCNFEVFPGPPTVSGVSVLGARVDATPLFADHSLPLVIIRNAGISHLVRAALPLEWIASWGFMVAVMEATGVTPTLNVEIAKTGAYAQEFQRRSIAVADTQLLLQELFNRSSAEESIFSGINNTNGWACVGMSRGGNDCMVFSMGWENGTDVLPPITGLNSLAAMDIVTTPLPQPRFKFENIFVPTLFFGGSYSTTFGGENIPVLLTNASQVYTVDALGHQHGEGSWNSLRSLLDVALGYATGVTTSVASFNGAGAGPHYAFGRTGYFSAVV